MPAAEPIPHICGWSFRRKRMIEPSECSACAAASDDFHDTEFSAQRKRARRHRPASASRAAAATPVADPEQVMWAVTVERVPLVAVPRREARRAAAFTPKRTVYVPPRPEDR